MLRCWPLEGRTTWSQSTAWQIARSVSRQSSLQDVCLHMHLFLLQQEPMRCDVHVSHACWHQQRA